ncbi:Hypothetical protein BRZCDTV_4 [Brazilian cedratvirus IHUMI]|uniref:Uncharacterized protein n=1 Tax=Brazilian cedratvirus IHUMI TaxID=2126980 RepID=A0A2R8FCQ6_9VIRU|nr:Hypothetical protein BRZCDTV_4 [Brazilian cedratvirus IHUMI]
MATQKIIHDAAKRGDYAFLEQVHKDKPLPNRVYDSIVRSDQMSTEEKKDLINKLLLLGVDHKCKLSALGALQEGDVQLYRFLVEEGFPLQGVDLMQVVGSSKVTEEQLLSMMDFVPCKKKGFTSTCCEHGYYRLLKKAIQKGHAYDVKKLENIVRKKHSFTHDDALYEVLDSCT